MSNITITLEWNPPLGSGQEAVVNHYEILVTPRPLSHPTFNTIFATSWNVTMKYNVEYTAIISAVNCVGKSSTALLPSILFSEYYKL